MTGEGRARGRPGAAWLTIRATAGLLAILVLAHFAATHFLTDVGETDSAFVAARWSSGIIAATDLLMLLAAVAHGAAGAWTVAGDVIGSPRRRRAVRGGVVALAVGMVALGTATLFTVLGR